jgi:hypothetical protein
MPAFTQQYSLPEPIGLVPLTTYFGGSQPAASSAAQPASVASSDTSTIFQ